MSWSYKPPNDSNIKFNIENDPENVLQIIEDQSFTALLRNNNNQYLFQYLFKETTMNILCDIVFTDAIHKQKNYRKSIRSVLTFFSTTLKVPMERIQSDPVLLSRIQSFIISKEPKDPYICGNFTQVIEYLVHNDPNGLYIKKIDDLLEFLIDNCHIIAFKDLLTNLLEGYAVLYEKHIIVNNLINMISGKNCPLISSISTILTNSTNKSRFAQYLNRFEVLRPLFDVIVGNNSYNNIIQALNVALQVKDLCIDPPFIGNDLIREYSQKFIFVDSKPKCILAKAITLFQVFNEALLSLVFNDNFSSYFNISLYNLINRNKDNEAFLSNFNLIANSVQICKLIETKYSTSSKYNPFYLLFANLVNNNFNITKSSTWPAFIDGINTKISEEKKQYGLKSIDLEPSESSEVSPPNSTSSSDEIPAYEAGVEDSDEEDYLYHEEEEEEEEEEGELEEEESDESQ